MVCKNWIELDDNSFEYCLYENKKTNCRGECCGYGGYNKDKEYPINTHGVFIVNIH